ncbi:hypothetical protein HWE04_13310 [Herbaspirillum sp. C7C2]|uniref:hypothetical protein n=1 Tax=Herbaspirillum sp. C7C2 TaxID=2736666 RepID=UPI001F51A50A|nr:hypothetical protein [Herbaspirillum sp. C7C2]MCI1014831.1 hypothetical protein [Herbaspirillum sp. C7C2]
MAGCLPRREVILVSNDASLAAQVRRSRPLLVISVTAEAGRSVTSIRQFQLAAFALVMVDVATSGSRVPDVRLAGKARNCDVLIWPGAKIQIRKKKFRKNLLSGNFPAFACSYWLVRQIYHIVALHSRIFARNAALNRCILFVVIE